MSDLINLLTSVFTGKGGTVRLAIVGSLAAGVLYEMFDSGYGFGIRADNGPSVVLAPSAAGSPKEPRLEDAMWQPAEEPANPAAPPLQHEPAAGCDSTSP